MFWGSVAKSCECPRSGGLLSQPAPDFMLSDAPVSYSCPTAGLEQVMMILTLGNAFLCLIGFFQALSNSEEGEDSPVQECFGYHRTALL